MEGRSKKLVGSSRRRRSAKYQLCCFEGLRNTDQGIGRVHKQDYSESAIRPRAEIVAEKDFPPRNPVQSVWISPSLQPRQHPSANH